MPPDRVTVEIARDRFEGWKSVSVTRSILQVAGTFALGTSERWDPSDRRIFEGDACRILFEGDPVIQGHIDTVERSYTAEDHGVTIQGRDATGDLVDCSAISEGGQFRKQTVTQIAGALADALGISVRADTEVGEAFDLFKLQEGETFFSAIERLTRMRGLLPVSDGEGGLLLTRAGTLRSDTDLIRGENILEGRATAGMADRFSEYTVKGHDRGKDLEDAEEVAGTSARSTDSLVLRYRPLVVRAEEPGKKQDLQQRADYEASRRAAAANQVEIKVAGWRQASGRLWQPNALTRVRDEWLGVNEVLLITSVTYSLDGGGSTATLQLGRPQAFTAGPFDVAANGAGGELWQA